MAAGSRSTQAGGFELWHPVVNDFKAHATPELLLVTFFNEHFFGFCKEIKFLVPGRGTAVTSGRSEDGAALA